LGLPEAEYFDAISIERVIGEGNCLGARVLLAEIMPHPPNGSALSLAITAVKADADCLPAGLAARPKLNARVTAFKVLYPERVLPFAGWGEQASPREHG
jgi:hypothetical protein